MKKILFAFVVLLALCSCGNKGGGLSGVISDEYKMNYTSLLTMQDCDGYVYAQIRDPWDTTRVLHSYILVERGGEVPGQLPEGDVVRVPLEKTIVYTSVHCSLIDEIGAYDAIRGVCDLQYIDIPRLQEDCKAGRIADIGSSLAPDIEAVIDLSPEAILLSPFQNSGSYGKLGKLDIPIIECADYMETSPLGRAEWMKFYGLLYGKKEQADSLFAIVSEDYEMTRDKVSEAVSPRPLVVMDMKQGGTWYVPGGRSTVGIMLADAGADYVFRERPESGSVPLDPEVVFDAALDADMWLIKYNQATEKTYVEMGMDAALYLRMKAFREKNIYGCNTALVPYYEETPFHPNLLLRDYIKLFHPEVLPEHEMRYFKSLEMK